MGSGLGMESDMVPLGTADVMRGWDNFSIMAAMCSASSAMAAYSSSFGGDFVSVLTRKNPDSLLGAEPSKGFHTGLSTL